MGFKTVVDAYSLAAGEVGKPIEGSLVITEHEDGIAALHALDDAIENPRTVPGQASRYQIEMPDGRRVAFDTAYSEIFGEAPIKRDNQGNLYPRLKKRKAKK